MSDKCAEHVSANEAYGHFEKLKPLPETSEELCFYRFRDPEKHSFTELTTLQKLVDVRDNILLRLHTMERTVFYKRVDLENVFLLWRYLVIHEGLADPHPTDQKLGHYLKVYNPFLFYRDIWDALLHPYWQEKKTPSSVRAEQLRSVVAEYFAQLLPCHPCIRIYCKRSEHTACFCCKSSKKASGCSPDFFQQGCNQRTVSLLLISSFADCLWRQIQAGNHNIAEDLFSEMLNAIHDGCDDSGGYCFMFWFFCADFLCRRAERIGTNTSVRRVKGLLKKTYESHRGSFIFRDEEGYAISKKLFLKNYIKTLKRISLSIQAPWVTDALSIDLDYYVKNSIAEIVTHWEITIREDA